MCLFIAQFIYQIVNNFSALLLRETNVLNLLNMVVFFQISSHWEVFKILTETHFWMSKASLRRYCLVKVFFKTGLEFPRIYYPTNLSKYTC